MRKGVGEPEGTNAKVQETGPVEDISGDNIDQVNNAEENIEEEHVDQENNAYQEGGSVLRVIPRSPSLVPSKTKDNVERRNSAASRRGAQEGIVKVEEKAKEKMKNNRKSG